MIFIDACRGIKREYAPVWMMRQAGRYLPQYREVRARLGSFLNLCESPKDAAEVTLQPVKELGVDAAIIFSDILIVPQKMGLELDFKENEGPVFANTVSDLASIERLKFGPEVASELGYMYEALELTRKKLDPNKALIGFCGAPWTLLTYMVEGKGSKSFAKSKKFIYGQKLLAHALLEKLTQSLQHFLLSQINAGANAVMIFDSWASALEASAYEEFGLGYIRKIASYLKRHAPDIPLIVFSRAAADFYELHFGDNVDVIALCQNDDALKAARAFGSRYSLQGNLEPARLYDANAIAIGVSRIRAAMDMGAARAHIFNLGHGIAPDTPVENAKLFVKLAQEPFI